MTQKISAISSAISRFSSPFLKDYSPYLLDIILASSYTIEILDDTTLRWKSDDERLQRVFNYTFAPIE